MALLIRLYNAIQTLSTSSISGQVALYPGVDPGIRCLEALRERGSQGRSLRSRLDQFAHCSIHLLGCRHALGGG